MTERGARRCCPWYSSVVLRGLPADLRFGARPEAREVRAVAHDHEKREERAGEHEGGGAGGQERRRDGEGRAHCDGREAHVAGEAEGQAIQTTPDATNTIGSTPTIAPQPVEPLPL